MNPSQSNEIERLFRQIYPLLVEYAESSLKNFAQAEEAAQDAFRIACQCPEALLHSPNPEGWLIITLRNVISNIYRRQAGAQRYLQEQIASCPPEKVMSHNEELPEFLYQDLADTEEFRLVKALVLDGKSYQELAMDRNITVGTCRKRMERAKKFLREKIRN